MGSKTKKETIEVSPAALVAAWRAVGAQIAVIAASGTAVVSLLQHTPVHIASMRGGIVWGTVMLVTSVGAWFAARTWRAPAVEEDDEPAEDEISKAA